MTFRVQPEALDGYAGQIDRAADDAEAVRRYLDKYTIQGGWNGALIELVGDAHTRSLNTATDLCGKISRTLYGSRDGLRAGALYYRTTDQAAAARLDSTLPTWCASAPTALEAAWANNVCGPSFSDSREPAGRLTPVDEIEYSHPFSVLDNISLSHWALEAFDAVFGFNPLEKTLEFFIGDWQAVAQAGVALGRAADGLHDLAYNVQGGAISLHGSWEGAAAGGAYQHFTRLASGADGMVNPMKEISGQFASIAHGVWSACEAASGYCKGMADAAIITGVAIAAGTVTAETVVGAVVGYGVAALEISRMLDAWAQATRVMNNLYSSVQAALGVIESQLSHLQGADLPDLSGYSTYRHPLANR